MIQYQADYDDVMVPVTGCDWGSPQYGSLDCPSYPELTQPYTKNWNIHRSPGDSSGESTYATMPDDSGPCTATDKGKCYGWRSNYGYNFMYLSLPVYGSGGSPNGRPNTQSSTAVGQPASTVMTTTSIWDRSGGSPRGGGNWAVNAPCYIEVGGASYAVPTSYSFYALSTSNGILWDPTNNASATQFGYVYPFFTGKTIVNTSFTDGHAKGLRIGDLSKGCNLTTGVIVDNDQFLWDLK